MAVTEAKSYYELRFMTRIVKRLHESTGIGVNCTKFKEVVQKSKNSDDDQELHEDWQELARNYKK